ncbi:hypothetical protein M569_04515 [Genlisea aurea]|uniref:Senescence regulator n=1 Tax=Genlisea aurea TaxID=192259 RepID=S8CTS0_9LAMI|nr:hypothetical protein M569_04515 [Genlisea aurea]
MAAPRSFFARPNRLSLPIDQGGGGGGVAAESMIFELDESDVWSTSVVVSQSPESRPRTSRKSSSSASRGLPASLPVNVPDWSKILKQEYRDHRRREIEEEEEEEDDVGRRIPPHELIARQMARARITSFSVHEGVGRTLKGRDLSRVRNAVWQKIGFED